LIVGIVSVCPTTGDDVVVDDWRILVQDIIRAGAQLQDLVHLPRGLEVQIAKGRDLRIEIVENAVRRGVMQRRVVGVVVLRDPTVSQDNNNGDPTLHFATFGAYDFYNATIPSYSYLDLEATWNVNKVLQIRAGANNILDKDPPVINTDIVSGGAANTYSIYDMFGRQLFVAFTAKF
jgi:hypothetical protein